MRQMKAWRLLGTRRHVTWTSGCLGSGRAALLSRGARQAAGGASGVATSALEDPEGHGLGDAGLAPLAACILYNV